MLLRSSIDQASLNFTKDSRSTMADQKPQGRKFKTLDDKFPLERQLGNAPAPVRLNPRITLNYADPAG
ncbi:hypothetical protein RA261_27800, partial [Pseudomonas syringae pv. tagetis]